MKGFSKMNADMRNVLHLAVVKAINDVGLKKFKAGSFFMSNNNSADDRKIAA